VELVVQLVERAPGVTERLLALEAMFVSE